MTNEETQIQPESVATESADSGDDLDDILREYDAETRSDETDDGSYEGGDSDDSEPLFDTDLTGDPRVDELYTWAQRTEQENSYYRQEREEREIQQDLDKAVEAVKDELSDLDVPLSERRIRDYLLAEATLGNRFRDAFNYRHQDPRGLESALRKAAKELRKESVSSEQYDDRDTVAAAVVASRSTKPEPEGDFPSASKMRKMSDAEFIRLTEQIDK